MIFDSFESGFQKKFIGSYDLKVADLSVKAGDTVTYYISARDNKPPLGNQSRSEELHLKILDAVGNDVARQQWQQDREIQEQILKEKRESQPGDAAGSDQPAEAQEDGSMESQEPREGAQEPAESKSEDSATEAQPKNSSTSGSGSETACNPALKQAMRQTPKRVRRPDQVRLNPVRNREQPRGPVSLRRKMPPVRNPAQHRQPTLVRITQAQRTKRMLLLERMPNPIQVHHRRRILSRICSESNSEWCRQWSDGKSGRRPISR